MYTIDPTQFTVNSPATSLTIALLEAIIKHTPKKDYPFIRCGKYPFRHQNQEIEVELTHHLLIRSRKNNGGQKRIEVLIPEKLGKGSFGEVYESLGVMIP